MSDPYSSWSGAPKQWIIVPPRRRSSPASRLLRPPAPPRRVRGGGIAGLALAALLLALGTPNTSVAHLDGPSPAPRIPAPAPLT